MRIEFVEIQNFRKLRSCRVEFAKETTVFAGANNSGKTSAMDAMILFLKKDRRKEIKTTDFTLSNWSLIEQIGCQWLKADDKNKPDLTLGQWLPYLPSIDIWIKADDADIHRIVHLLPTLDWTPSQKLGIRLVLAPKDIEKLYKEFRVAYENNRSVEKSASPESKLSLWPKSMRDFLDKELHKYFEVEPYILDSAKCCDTENGVAKSQLLTADSEPMDKEPFDGLFKIDIISAQRGFSDPKTEDDSHGKFASLSTQLRKYFTKHLDPSEFPDPSDVKALEAIEAAKAVFDDKLKTSFKPAIGELEGLNYPGFSDPQISLTSNIRADGLTRETAVQFNVSPPSDDGVELSLPEQYNGLGYQNLISMVFNLIRFRDEWMRVGKAAKKTDSEDVFIEPLHVVLIEEPEAHLHAQVQQVFIKKAYQILRNSKKLENSCFKTQMIVSTHSSHIAHELDFTCLRYFRREPAMKKGEIPFATVVNLSKTFGDETETSKFATRYIKSTHCDLFFADAAILIEGSAERMLVPHFIRHKFQKLDQSYISLLEIGGSHAHQLRPLLETLALPSLVITDLDSIGGTDAKKILPEPKKGYRTSSATLKEWIPQKELLDELLTCPDAQKQSTNKLTRVAYQCPIKLKYKNDSNEEEVIPYTFEDSLALTNMELFRNYQNPKGLLKKIQDALSKNTLKEACEGMFDSLKDGSKAEMALELLYRGDPSKLDPPAYISAGLQWLENKLAEKKQDFQTTATTEVKNG